MKSVIYHLGGYRANFNFFEFLVAQATYGATHVVIDKTRMRKDYSMEETLERIASIIEPGCALAGCTYSYSSDPQVYPIMAKRVGYHISVVIDAWKAKGKIRKLESVLPPKNERYTVTLRKSSENDRRNSNEAAWREFAEEISAFVIEDYADRKIDLHERMAYYAGAEMNYFVANGPAILCSLSDYPYTIFMKNVQEKYNLRHGVWLGQLPWANKRQLCVWEDDSIENLRQFRPLPEVANG